MREDYINIKFSLDNPIYFKIGSYVDCDFGRFEVCDVQKASYNTGTSAYDYDLRLDAYYWKWKNKIFRYTPESFGQEAAWNLTASLDVQASIIIRNLKALGYKYNGQDFTFSIDNTVDNKSRLMSYNNTSILDACFSMAEKWNCECWITDSVIHFGRCEFGDAIDFNIGVNVEDMTRSDSQTGYATRIYAFGSTRNIPSNYRPSDSSILVNGVVQKRLMLPVGVPYIDAYTDMSTEEAIEQVVVFDNIYPSRVGTMTDVSSYEHSVKNDDDTTTTETFYRFTDAGINFSKDYLLDGSELRIVFQSGLLNGMDFAVKFNPNGVSEKLGNGNWNPEAQLYEIIVNEDYGRKLPDTILKPKVGDKYILHGFDSLKIGDMSYISSAEQELKTHAEKYVAKSNTDPSTYDCRMMSDTMIDGYGNAQLYEVGQRVNLLNPAYFEDGRVSRIIGFEYNLDIPFDIPIYTVGETAAYSRIKELENKVDELVYKGQAYVGGGTGVYLITSFDRTSPSDSNTFSARRALKEFLSKIRPDRTPYSLEVGEDLTVERLLKVLTRLEVGETVDSLLAGKGIIAENGRIQADRMELRSSLTVLRLIINEIQAMAGDYSFSDCGYIERVDKIDDSTYKLWMEKRTDTDWTNLDEHDVLLSIVNSLLTGGTDYYSSWFRCVSKNRNENSLTVVLYPDSEVPGGKNYPPVEGYNVTRKGNAVMPEAGETNERAQSWLISSREGRIMFLQNVFKPILEDYNYAISIGRFPSVKMIRKLPISPTDVGIMAKTIVAENFYQADWNGDIIPKKVDRDEWSLAVAQGESPYRNVSHEVTLENQSVVTQLEQHTVYHYGCKWGCVIDKTADEPKWNAPGWILLEGDKNYHLDFTSTNGWQFFHRSVDTVVSAVVSYGNRDITEVLMASDGVQVEWLRDTGNVPADNAWQPTYVDGKKHAIHLTRADMGSEWGLSVRKVRFVCRVFIPIGGGKFETTENYIGFKL